MSAQNVLNATLTAVAQGKVHEVSRLLGLFSLGKQTTSNANKLLLALLRVAYKSNASMEMYRAIYDAWDSANSDEEYPVLGSILRVPGMTSDILLPLLESQKYNFIDAVESLSSYPSDPCTEVAYTLIKDTLGYRKEVEIYESILEYLTPRTHIEQVGDNDEPLNEWGDIKDMLQEFSLNVNRKGNIDVSNKTPFNKVLYELVLADLKDIKPDMLKPNYLISSPSHEIRVDSQNIIDNDPTSEPRILPETEEAADLLTKSLLKYSKGLDERTITKAYRESYDLYEQTTTDFMKIRLLQPVYTSTFLTDSDTEAIRKYGPANTFVTAYGAGLTQSSRMFTCIKYFDDVEDDVEFNPDNVHPLDWFSGSCEKCNNKIPHYWWAVRMPKAGGGWIGTYCSWKCVRDDLILPDSDIVAQFDESGVQLNLIDHFEQLINTVGIYDRQGRPKGSQSLTDADEDTDGNEERLRDMLSRDILNMSTLAESSSSTFKFPPLNPMASSYEPLTLDVSSDTVEYDRDDSVDLDQYEGEDLGLGDDSLDEGEDLSEDEELNEDEGDLSEGSGSIDLPL